MKPFGTKTKLSDLQSPLKVHWRIFLNPFGLTRYQFLNLYKVFECELRTKKPFAMLRKGPIKL